MTRDDWPSEGWFYKQAGETRGPVSAEELQKLLVASRVQPGQAVWRRQWQCLLFVQAARAASGTAGGSARPATSGPASA